MWGMKKYILILSLVYFFALAINPSFAFDLSGNAALETGYDSNIEGETDHTVGGEAGNPKSDFLTLASLFLNLQGGKKNKIQYSLSLNEIEKLYFDEYEENTNRHIGEVNISIPLSPDVSFNIDDRAILHFQPKEDLRNFFSNYSSFSLSYQIDSKNTLSAGYMNNLKKYPNSDTWNFMKNSFFFQVTHRLSDSFWLTASYEGTLYRGRNNFFDEKKELEAEGEKIPNVFDGKTAKGNEHHLTFSGNKIFDNGSALSLKYRFVSNSVDEVTEIEEDRELAEFEGAFAYENDEQDFNYTLNEATLILSMTIIENVELDVILLYQFQNFDGDAFLLEDKRSRRLDRLAVADVTISVKLRDNLELKLRNAAIYNESNYPEREYDRSYTSIALNYYF